VLILAFNKDAMVHRRIVFSILEATTIFDKEPSHQIQMRSVQSPPRDIDTRPKCRVPDTPPRDIDFLPRFQSPDSRFYLEDMAYGMV
jgi:hypothetical protein